MCGRVVPTKPGWWWVRWLDRDFCVEVMEVTTDDGEVWFATVDHDTQDIDVRSDQFNWLAPVPSAESVHAAVETLEEYATSRKFFRDYERAREIEIAIAGLTGGEG